MARSDLGVLERLMEIIDRVQNLNSDNLSEDMRAGMILGVKEAANKLVIEDAIRHYPEQSQVLAMLEFWRPYEARGYLN